MFSGLFSLMALVAVIGCGSACPKTSCYAPGTYIDANDALGATSAEICLDTACTTVPALTGPDDVFTGFNVNTWQEGRDVVLRLTVFAANGRVIDSLSEKRKMDSSGCACGVLYYGWKAGHLHRVN
jgi:hypothetical protein